MPNNGIISKQAVIPGSFIVESAESTDLVIINTPLTGSRVEQKAVPVSALGGGAPYYSFVYKLALDSNLEDISYPIYNSFPQGFDIKVDVTVGGDLASDPVQVTIYNTGENDLDFSISQCIIDSFQTSEIFVYRKYNLNYGSGSNIIISIPSLGEGGEGANLLIYTEKQPIVEVRYYPVI